MPDTRPVFASTVAMVGALEDQTTLRPVKTLAFASVAVAVNCAVEPATTTGEAGVTATVATGTCAATTVTADVPDCPSLVAVIVAVPGAMAAMRPLGSTDAMVGLPDD